METYRTLSFNSKKTAMLNQKQINEYFGTRLVDSNILYGVDERNNIGYYVKYIIC